MKKFKLRQVLSFLFFTFLFSHYLTVNAQQTSYPHLRKQGTATQLIVGGKPFLVRGGELGNSSSSDAEYMRPVWEKLARMNLNAVLVPFYWELIEPEEGKFDFALIDELILAARKNNILSAREGGFENGKWIGGRWLNGDQTHQGRHIRLETNKFSIQRVKLYRYQ